MKSEQPTDASQKKESSKKESPTDKPLEVTDSDLLSNDLLGELYKHVEINKMFPPTMRGRDFTAETNETLKAWKAARQAETDEHNALTGMERIDNRLKTIATEGSALDDDAYIVRALQEKMAAAKLDLQKARTIKETSLAALRESRLARELIEESRKQSKENKKG